MKLRFTRRALENLSEIAEYLNNRNPAAARRVRSDIEEGLGILKLFPSAGRAQTTEGVRKLVSRKYGYLIYYTPREDSAEVIILSIRHSAREREHDDA